MTRADALDASGWLLTSVLAVAMVPVVASAQDACPRAALPAYAHNDYANARPLHDALALGFRGVEADVFLVDGALRVGHDRKAALGGATLDSLYLAPLRALVARCGALSADGRPFLLTIELKEASLAAHDSLIAVLARSRAAFVNPRVAHERAAAVQVVLVGWHPPSAIATETRARPWMQHRLTHAGERLEPGLDSAVRLISLDYGKTVGRRWTRESTRRRWLATLRAARADAPDRLLRAYNVPVDSAVYATLLGAGVDLIGTKDLRTTHRMLAHRGDGGAP